MLKRINKIFEKIPIGWINFMAIISFVGTMIIPLIGFVVIKIMHLDGTSLFWGIYIITLCVLIGMLINMFRYMVKYRKILVAVKGATSECLFHMNRQFRNSYFDIIQTRKDGKLSVEYLTTKVEGVLKSSLDDICEIYRAFTGQKVSACIKYIDSVGPVEVDTATIRTFVRSSNTAIKRCEFDNNLSTPIYIKDNSDFYDILSPNSDRSYFYQQNLVEYAKKCEKQGSGYRNSTPDWHLYYQGTIVVPISIANKRLNKKKSCYDVLAFLCIDSMSTEAFLKSEESYNINIARAVAAQMYIMLNQYRQYLKKLTEVRKHYDRKNK